MKSSIFFLLVVILIGCGSGEQRPAGLLDHETFKETLLQAQLIDAKASQEMSIAHDPAAGRPRAAYDAMFKEQGITEAQFDPTFAYYQAHPLELKALYEEILAELGKRKDELPQ